MFDASKYSQHHSLQSSDARQFMDNVVAQMDWSHEDQDVVMDIGCGTGDTTRDVLLEAFSRVKSVVGVDILPKMIEFAKKESSHPKISYHVADLEDRPRMMEWRNSITKVVSIYCLHWIGNQPEAFKTIFDLLKPEGEAALLFVGSAHFWYSFPDHVTNPKWSKYLQNANQHKPESHYYNYGPARYRAMLEAVGFTVIVCEDQNRTFVYKNDADCKLSCSSICTFTKHIPDALLAEFEEEVLQSFVKYNGRTEDGRPCMKHRTFTLLVKKPHA